MQVQAYPFTMSAHAALLRHGPLRHSSISSSQRVPWKPQSQPQLKSPRPTSVSVDESLQTAPLVHGVCVHSSTSTSQSDPANPSGHSHT
jgi:hypothetical protein